MSPHGYDRSDVDVFVRAVAVERKQLWERIISLETALEATVDYLQETRQPPPWEANQAPKISRRRGFNPRQILTVSHRLTFGLGALVAAVALVSSLLFLREWRGDLFRFGYSTVSAAVGDGPHKPPVAAIDNQPTTFTSDSHSGARPVAKADPAVQRSLVQSNGLTIGLRARSLCWIGVSIDQQRRVERLVQPGEDVTLHARDELLLRAGNAGALLVTLNGLPAMPLGGLGQAVTTRITLANYRQFVGALP
jgi:hypothetical protein